MGWFGEIPHLPEESDWDDGLADALQTIKRDGALTAYGFGSEPGFADDYRPVKAKPKRRACRKPAAVTLPVVTRPAVALPPKAAPLRLQSQAFDVVKARAQAEIERQRRQALSAQERFAQERIGMQWAMTQLQNIAHQIGIHRMRGDTYRADLMEQAARRVLSAYPGLRELQSAALLLGLS